MVFGFAKWMFINLMVVMGLTFLATYSPIAGVFRPSRYPWREVLAFTAMSVFFMLNGWVVAPGQQIDIRMAALGLAGWLFGWPAAAFTGVVTLAVRVWMGGPGVQTSIVLTFVNVAMVALFQRYPRNAWSVGLLGFAQATALFVVGQAMVHPSPKGLEPTNPFWLLIFGACTLSTILLHGAIEHVLERRHLQRALAEELGAKEALLALIPHGIVVLDRTRRVLSANQAAQYLMDGSQVPAPILEHPDVAKALLEGRKLSGCRVSYQTADGADRIVLVSAVPQGKRVVLGLENVTGVVHQERQAAQRERLELLGQLAALAAHEIKNPLTTIKGFLQLLERRPEFSHHASSFALLQSEVEHINRVVGDFLVLSGQPSKQPVKVQLDDLLGQLIDVMRLQHPGVPVQVELTGESGLCVEADQQSIKQILKNLVSNAFEAMQSGGTLTIVRRPVGGAVEVSVRDTGQGIAPDVLPLIFRPYLTTKATGTGLGLSISHKLAAEMGGQLEVYSEQGKGCTFVLTLPQCGAAPRVESLGGISNRAV